MKTFFFLFSRGSNGPRISAEEKFFRGLARRTRARDASRKIQRTKDKVGATPSIISKLSLWSKVRREGNADGRRVNQEFCKVSRPTCQTVVAEVTSSRREDPDEILVVPLEPSPSSSNGEAVPDIRRPTRPAPAVPGTAGDVDGPAILSVVRYIFI